MSRQAHRPGAPAAPPSASQRGSFMSHSSSQASRTVLIAAGSAELRAAIAAPFGGLNCRLVIAVNGKDALDKLKAHHFDLVVSGIEMAELDGIELLAKLAKTKPRLPVFIVAEGKSEI